VSSGADAAVPSAPAIVLIAALDREFAIGRGNTLPWSLPDDLKRFKAITLGKPLLMGRKTAESLGRALPGRRNLVLTRSGRVPFEGMEPVASVEEARALCADSEALMVIGGGEVYAACLPMATQLHLTWVGTTVAGADAWFPPLDASEWTMTDSEVRPADARHAHAFRFADYVRR
jgi:dihydrofolate reductase